MRTGAEIARRQNKGSRTLFLAPFPGQAPPQSRSYRPKANSWPASSMCPTTRSGTTIHRAAGLPTCRALQLFPSPLAGEGRVRGAFRRPCTAACGGAAEGSWRRSGRPGSSECSRRTARGRKGASASTSATRPAPPASRSSAQAGADTTSLRDIRGCEPIAVTEGIYHHARAPAHERIEHPSAMHYHHFAVPSFACGSLGASRDR